MGDKRLFTYEELQDHAATVQKVALDNGRAEGRADEREQIVTLLKGLRGQEMKIAYNTAIEDAIAAIKSTEDVCPTCGSSHPDIYGPGCDPTTGFNEFHAQTTEGEKERPGVCVEHGTWNINECEYGQCPQCGDKLVPTDTEGEAA